MSTVRIAGVGLIPFGSYGDRAGRELFAAAALAAFEDAGVEREAVDQLNYGNFMGALTEHQGHQAPLMAEAAGLSCPAITYEEACASSGAAIREAVRTIRSGEAEVILAGGMERMTTLDTGEATAALAIAADELYEVRGGVTFPSAYALMARAYFETFGGDREDLAHIAVKNHKNGAANPHAQFRKEISLERALDSPPVATPLSLYDACPISDGASAVLLVSEAFADDHDLDAPVSITGTGQGGDRLALQDRETMAETPATAAAAKEAYADAGITADDVDFAEVHDCFTIAEVMAIESLGLVEPGEGITAAREGRTTADGEIPINLSGGLKAKGHPVGASGGSQIAEVTHLLRGDHPNSDAVEDTTVGLTHSAGGTVGSAVVTVLEVEQ